MYLSSEIKSAAACSMASMVSCNSVTTLTLGLASRTIDTDVIMLPRISLSHLQSYPSEASQDCAQTDGSGWHSQFLVNFIAFF